SVCHPRAAMCVDSPLPLHDALPIWGDGRGGGTDRVRGGYGTAGAAACPAPARRHAPRPGRGSGGSVVAPHVDRPAAAGQLVAARSEEHTSELQSRENLVCRLLLEKK